MADANQMNVLRQIRPWWQTVALSAAGMIGVLLALVLLSWMWEGHVAYTFIAAHQPPVPGSVAPAKPATP